MAGSSTSEQRRPKSLDVAVFKPLLEERFHPRVFYQNGNLNVHSLVKLINDGHDISQVFIGRVNAQFPTARLPVRNVKPDAPALPSVHNIPLHEDDKNILKDEDEEDDGDRQEEDREADAARREEEGRNRDAHNKVRFTWMLQPRPGKRDELNLRKADGTLLPPTRYTGPLIEGTHRILSTDDIPPELMDDLYELRDRLYDCTGKAFYDPEELALGTIPKKEYLLLPSNWAIEECPIEYVGVGVGVNVYKVDCLTIACVYKLAKEQAKTLGFSNEKAIRWAVLRMEAVKSGWFASQKHTKFVPGLAGSAKLFIEDGEKIVSLTRAAYNLCAFLPFFAEFHFRTYGSCYNKTTGAEYIQRAEKLAASSRLADIMNYLDKDVLFGSALGWVGVKRPMEVLTHSATKDRIPSAFIIRKKSAPSGRALITTAAAMIKSLQSANWWDSIAEAGNYDERSIVAMASKITDDPWKYHMMHHMFGVAGPSAEEEAAVEEAKQRAILYSPILQAYAESINSKGELSRAQVLKKHATTNVALYEKAKTVFRKALRKRGHDVMSMFVNEVFLTKRQRTIAPGEDEEARNA